jgi:hypothetical protein
MPEENEIESETVVVELPRKMLKRFMDARNAWQAKGTPEGTPEDAEFGDAMQDFIATTVTAMLFDEIDVKAMEGLALQYGKERITSVVQSAAATDGSAIRPETILVHDAKDIAASRGLDFGPNDVVSPDTIDNIAERKRAWGEWKS